MQDCKVQSKEQNEAQGLARSKQTPYNLATLLHSAAGRLLARLPVAQPQKETS